TPAEPRERRALLGPCRTPLAAIELTRQFRVLTMSYMRSEARQRQILACAKKVFAQRGFHAANVSHICAEAGIGRGTLYQYFANKHSGLTAILRDTLERVRGLMETMSRETAYPPAETVTKSTAIAVSTKQLRRVLAVVFEDGDMLRILLREAVGLDS